MKKLLAILSAGLIAAGIYYYRKPLSENVSQLKKTIVRLWDTIPAKAEPYLSALKSAELINGLPATLLTRIAYIESNFNPNAYNTKSGATGMMQIIPFWHPNVDAKNPYASIEYAGKYLRDLYNQFGAWDKAIAAYNWGSGNLTNAISRRGNNWRLALPSETRNYLDRVEQVIDLPA